MGMMTFCKYCGAELALGSDKCVGLAAGILVAISLSVVYIVIWIWQIFNARTLAKKFNEQVKLTGKEPW